jgi:hypothetical protein
MREKARAKNQVEPDLSMQKVLKPENVWGGIGRCASTIQRAECFDIF